MCSTTGQVGYGPTMRLFGLTLGVKAISLVSWMAAKARLVRSR